MVLDKPLEDITRSKKKFKLSQEDFFKGEWLNELKKTVNFDKIDVVYKGGYLIASFFKKTQSEVKQNE